MSFLGPAAAVSAVPPSAQTLPPPPYETLPPPSYGTLPPPSYETNANAQARPLSPPPPAAAATFTAPVKQMSYKELERTVETWLHNLTQRENEFLRQATTINKWDKQLIENGEQVTAINREVEHVQTDQTRLDKELDYILSQQEELHNLLRPIEANILSQNLVDAEKQCDAERSQTYGEAENVDNQLKKMMGDLREIIDRINQTNIGSHQYDGDTITKISKILNSHMDSLHWIDQNTQQLQNKVNDVTHIMDKQQKYNGE